MSQVNYYRMVGVVLVCLAVPSMLLAQDGARGRRGGAGGARGADGAADATGAGRGGRGARGPQGFGFGTLGQQPTYPIPYRMPTTQQVTDVMTRVRDFIDLATPTKVVDRVTNKEVTDFSQPNLNATPVRSASTFQITSYEQGVAYLAMIRATEVTGDPRFAEYTAERFQLLKNVLPSAVAQNERDEAARGRGGRGNRGAADGAAGDAPANAAAEAPATNEAAGFGARGGFRGFRGGAFRSIVAPRTLDDCGAMCAAMIAARRADVGPDMKPIIDAYIKHITTGQFRLPDGTLARKDPQPESLWLDDLYMSVPALSQMGKLTGDTKYYDDAARQILQFSQRMFNKDLGIYMHGWAADMPEHPEFHWGRANGWAIMAMVELLDVMPEDHPQRNAVLEQLRAHIKGLAALQSGEGRWHNLLDRPDTYLETSASAMFVYGITKAINRGWVSAPAYASTAILGWNAVANKVNQMGAVEDVCVGTGMAFDPAYYYYRPTSITAVHGYGPVVLAGSEMIKLVRNENYHPVSNGIQLAPGPASAPAQQPQD